MGFYLIRNSGWQLLDRKQNYKLLIIRSAEYKSLLKKYCTIFGLFHTYHAKIAVIAGD